MNSRRGRVGHDIAHTVTPSATQGFYSVKCIDMNPNPSITDLARCITARQDNGIGHHSGEKSGALFLEKPVPVLTPAKEKNKAARSEIQESRRSDVHNNRYRPKRRYV